MPTPAEERIFLKRIAARFRDGAPRLQFADYLDESTDPSDHARAEFIRLQVTMADAPADHPRRAEWTDRQNELLLKHHDEWTRPLKGLADGFEFRRWVVDSVTVGVPRFLARGEELFRRATIRRV
ncbi:MAG: TIGR02996 domain-containing protein, partial [Gemmataceae bacterium]